jgi:tetratricopeptide (TPR) repeat protein
VTEIRLPPLSLAAVERLGGGLAGAKAVHDATGGNPFFVSEVLAGGWTGTEPVPTTVRDAVLTRVQRLGMDAQRAARAAAVLGPAIPIPVVLDVAGVGRGSIDECVAHALLFLHDGTVSFRHELARLAVVDSLTPAEASALHRRCLDALRVAAPVDWPRLARHAVAAGDGPAILELAPAAGRAAANLGAHREAATFFGAALGRADAMTARDHADVLELHAHELSLIDDVLNAVTAQRRALAVWRSTGERVREGHCLTELSGLLWLAGDGEAALSTAQAAVDLLRTEGPGSPELAWACAVLAQRMLVAGGDDSDTVATASLAVELADHAGNERVVVHALTTLAVARIFLGEAGGWTQLEEAVARARSAGLPEATARAMINLVETARDFRRLDVAERYLADATSYLEEHDLDLFDHILRSRVAALELDAGRWDAALADSDFLLSLEGIANPIRVRALTIRGLVRARRGERTAWPDLDEPCHSPRPSRRTSCRSAPLEPRRAGSLETMPRRERRPHAASPWAAGSWCPGGGASSRSGAAGPVPMVRCRIPTSGHSGSTRPADPRTRPRRGRRSEPPTRRLWPDPTRETKPTSGSRSERSTGSERGPCRSAPPPRSGRSVPNGSSGVHEPALGRTLRN